jgi:hypothetical protein
MSEQTFCANCGAQNPSDALFCEKCGQPTTPPNEPPAPYAAAPTPYTRPTLLQGRTLPGGINSRALLLSFGIILVVWIVFEIILSPVYLLFTLWWEYNMSLDVIWVIVSFSSFFVPALLGGVISGYRMIPGGTRAAALTAGSASVLVGIISLLLYTNLEFFVGLIAGGLIGGALGAQLKSRRSAGAYLSNVETR